VQAGRGVQAISGVQAGSYLVRQWPQVKAKRNRRNSEKSNGAMGMSSGCIKLQK
jgi:hypothetical protein